MNVEGYRQTAFKTRHANLVPEKEADFQSRGEVTKVVKQGMYYRIFVKIKKELGVNEIAEVVEITPDEKQSGEDLGDSVDAGEEV